MIFFIGFFLLLYFSFLDIKYQQLDNGRILAFFLIGLVYTFFVHNIFHTAIGLILMSIFVLPLWYFKQIGGADTKLLIALVPYLNIINPISIILFMILFAFLGSGYGIIYKIITSKKTKEIPLIPIIYFNYALFWFIKSYILFGL